MKKIIFFIFAIGVGLLGYYLYLQGKLELTNPISKVKDNTRSMKGNYKVYGFLPTWMVGKTKSYCQEVTHLVFLGVEVDEKGGLVWDSHGLKINDQNYLDQKAQLRLCGGKNIVGVKLFDDDKIKKLMASSEAKSNLIRQIKAVVLSGGFDGVNIDFEYQGNPTAVLEDEFNEFLRELKKNQVGEISMDVFVNTINKGDEEGLNKMLQEVDSLLIMAYDFHRPGVDFAGPVAPIGAPEYI